MTKQSKPKTLNSCKGSHLASHKGWFPSPNSQCFFFSSSYLVQCQQLQVVTHNIQNSSLKDEHLSHLKYNGYESHWWTLNKDLKDFHLSSKMQIASLQWLKNYSLHWSIVYIVRTDEWWNCTMQTFWTGYHWHEQVWSTKF